MELEYRSGFQLCWGFRILCAWKPFRMALVFISGQILSLSCGMVVYDEICDCKHTGIWLYKALYR